MINDVMKITSKVNHGSDIYDFIIPLTMNFFCDSIFMYFIYLKKIGQFK